MARGLLKAKDSEDPKGSRAFYRPLNCQISLDKEPGSERAVTRDNLTERPNCVASNNKRLITCQLPSSSLKSQPPVPILFSGWQISLSGLPCPWVPYFYGGTIEFVFLLLICLRPV